MSKQSLGMLLHLRRKSLGLRQTYVAKRVRISQSALSKIERGALVPGLVDAYRLLITYSPIETPWIIYPPLILGARLSTLATEAARKVLPGESARIRRYWRSHGKAKRKLLEALLGGTVG